MVTIVDVQKRKNKGGKDFNVLFLQGSLETVISKELADPT
jgi:hypothetical protein